jgi:GTPase SAR1 family protein
MVLLKEACENYSLINNKISNWGYRIMSKEPKIVVMGSENVGKTTIMEKLIGNIGKVEYNGTTVE